jgi:nucleoside-diphosphate-sugar epimerase
LTFGKYYGVHLGPVKVPLEESFPRYDDHGYNFYYAPSLADLSVWVASHDHCKDEVFNHTNGDVFVWKYMWQDFAAYFGLEVRTLLRLTFVRRILTITGS